MAYDDGQQPVPIDAADRQRAQEHLANAVRDLTELSEILARTLNRTDDDRYDMSAGFGIIIGPTKKEFDAIDVTVATYCSSRGECLGVFDAVDMVCRPCTETEAAKCLMCG